MSFEFDENKSSVNKQKHGINFVEIQSLWEDERRIEVPARTNDEPRLLVIGRCKEKIWSCITTMRNGNIRIISARRARIEEVTLYESQ